MITILHTADIHLDSPLKSLALRDPELREQVQAATRAAFTRIVDAALEHGVSALLIAGDLYDGAARSARTAAFLINQLDRLRAAAIPVFLITGNHDAENPITGDVSLPGNVHTFGPRGGKVQLEGQDVWIHGVSYSSKSAPDSLLPKFHAPVDDAINIAMLHTSLAGAAGHDTYAPCSLGELADSGFDYWALGHIHKRQVHGERPWIVMPGIPQGRDIGESGPQSATLLTIENGAISISEVPTAGVEFRRRTIDASLCTDEDALRAEVRESLRREAEGESGTAILRLKFTGPFPERWRVERDREGWEAFCSEYVATTARLWIDKVEFALTDPVEEKAETASATAELAAFMETIRAEPGFAAAMEDHLDTVLRELSPTLRDELVPDAASQAALVERLAKDGARHVGALLRGADR